MQLLKYDDVDKIGIFFICSVLIVLWVSILMQTGARKKSWKNIFCFKCKTTSLQELCWYCTVFQEIFLKLEHNGLLPCETYHHLSAIWLSSNVTIWITSTVPLSQSNFIKSYLTFNLASKLQVDRYCGCWVCVIYHFDLYSLSKWNSV